MPKVWLDLLSPSDADRIAAEHEVGFRIQARDEISEIESSSRMSVVGDVLYLNTPVSYRDADNLPAIEPVGFALSPTHLVTIRFAAMAAFDTYHERFASLDAPSSAGVFAGLLEAIVDRVADVLEQVGLDLAALSRQTFQDGRGPPGSTRAARDLRATLSNLGLSANKIDNLRDTLLGLARIVSFVQQSGVAGEPDDIKKRLATLRADIASLNDYDQQLTAKNKLSARCHHGLHQYRAERGGARADRVLGRRHSADVRRRALRHEFQEHAGIRLALWLPMGLGDDHPERGRADRLVAGEGKDLAHARTVSSVE